MISAIQTQDNLTKLSAGGGIGLHSRLKICTANTVAGSSPAPRTKLVLRERNLPVYD